MQCRLCLNNRKLCDSHIVPEFLYDDLYNDDHKMMGINGLENRRWKTLQKGIREHLLCSDCEQHLNDKYEKPFHKQWLVDLPLPGRIAENAAHTVVYDYLTFKLFHLSILFRASVSSLPTFREVNLGVHEERIRKMLISESPGQDWEYPILAFAVLNGHGEVETRLISRPIFGRHEGQSPTGRYTAVQCGGYWSLPIATIHSVARDYNHPAR